ncbi:C-C motif chemokine 4-like [Epinephelus moara]|uniref:C-C motif chemokine 4-like n=1 Tax=Epinephelus moara TaxID=300413 RepID=UPI00214F2ED3|nr:C-C motif chemokine 4-like [Epinephelus moara]
MKTLVTLALLTLICFLRHSSGTVAVDAVTKDGCCPGFNRTHIPKGFVKDIAKTPNNCSPKAIVFTTVCEEKYCIDATWTWAQKRQAEFKESPSVFNIHKCDKKDRNV